MEDRTQVAVVLGESDAYDSGPAVPSDALPVVQGSGVLPVQSLDPGLVRQESQHTNT